MKLREVCKQLFADYPLAWIEYHLPRYVLPLQSRDMMNDISVYFRLGVRDRKTRFSSWDKKASKFTTNAEKMTILKIVSVNVISRRTIFMKLLKHYFSECFSLQFDNHCVLYFTHRLY